MGIGAYKELESWQEANGYKTFFEGMVALKAIEQSSYGYKPEWKRIPVAVRGQYYEFMAAGRAMMEPIGGWRDE